MTNDKDRELIERLALEVYSGIPIEARFSLPEYTKEFATRFIARYLAERGGEAVAYVRRHPDGALTAEYIEAELIEPVRKNSGAWLPLFLAPQPAIPEGMALVPIEPTDEMIKSGKWQIQALNGLESAYKAMIAAAGASHEPRRQASS